MKQIIFILSSLILCSQTISQNTRVYDIKGEGSITPTWSISHSSNGIRIDLDIESIASKQENLNGKHVERIILKEGVGIMEPGQPDIQYLSTSIAIPNFGKPVIVPIAAEYFDFPSFDIAPSRGDPGLINYPQTDIDTSIYKLNRFWPNTIISCDDPYVLADIRGLSVHFNPVQYNPITHTLRVYHHISVLIETSDEKGINEVTKISPVTSQVMQNVISQQFINAFDYLPSSNRYVPIEEQGNMLIICHPNFIDEIKPLVAWKIQKGINCKVIDVSKIGDATKIKEFVNEYYYSNGLTYLLLVGDDKFIPSNQGTKGASDNMFGYISGDDHYPEILIGRFSCETPEQCKTMVDRTINYEKNPSNNSDFDNLLGIGSSQGPGDDGELDYEHIRNIGAITASVYKNFTELYDGSRGGFDLNGNPTASLAIEAINSGQGTIMYLGHGSINSWLTTGFSTINARELQNTETYPFIWSAGCDNGSFVGSTCLAEEFLRVKSNEKPAGAVAAFMSSTNQTWYPPMAAQDEIALYLSGKKQISGPLTFGGISISGCMKMNDEYNRGAYVITDHWILFGDPSLEIRTSKPIAFQPSHISIIGSDAPNFSILGIDSGAYVCISSQEQILCKLRAESKNCIIPLPNLSGYKNFTLTITGTNRVPYIAEIEITDMPARAINPHPGNNTYKVQLNDSFSWEFGQGCIPKVAKFYIKKSNEETWTCFFLSDIYNTNLPVLEYKTMYEWKIETINDSGSSVSEIFKFETIERPDEDFEQEGFPRSNWMNDHEWYIDNSTAWEGNYSLHSGNTATRSTSSLFYECETLSCDYISFMMKLNIQNGAGLSFYIDNFLVAEWNYTTDWININYQIESGKHLLEWRFNGFDSIANNCAAWIDNIYLPINDPILIGSLIQETCPVNEIQLQANIENYASLKWTTEGTGYFDDPTRKDAIYFPSEEDLLQENIFLDIMISNNMLCPEEHYSYKLELSRIDIGKNFADTTIYLGEKFSIPSIPQDIKQSIFIGNLNDSIQYESAATKLSPGKNTVVILYENEAGCKLTKEFTVNLINSERPTNHSLTIYPNPSNENITIIDPSINSIIESTTSISIYNSSGLLIEQIEGTSNVSNRIQINHLKPGLYIIHSENSGNRSTGRFIKI